MRRLALPAAVRLPISSCELIYICHHIRFLVSWHDPHSKTTLYLARSQPDQPVFPTRNHEDASCVAFIDIEGEGLAPVVEGNGNSSSRVDFSHDVSFFGDWAPGEPPHLGALQYTDDRGTSSEVTDYAGPLILVGV